MIKRVFGAIGIALLSSSALAQTQSVLPNGMTQFVDGNGQPYQGGHVYMYLPKTTTPKATYQDPYGTSPNSNPITLDADGRAIIWGSGLYRQVLQDRLGSTVWDQQTLAPSAGGAVPGTAGVNQYLVTASPYSAKCDGVTNDTTAIQAALDAAGGAGGGEVLIPAGKLGCYLTGTLSVKNSGVTLRGATLNGNPQVGGTTGAFLTFANGSADDIDIGFQTGQINGNGVRDLFIQDSGKTGGTSISVKNTSYTTIQDVMVNNAYNGVWFNRINNAAIKRSVIQATVNGNQWGMQYNTTNSSGSVRSDVLTISDVVIQMNNASGKGFIIDGFSNDIHADHFSILGAGGAGLEVDNSSGSPSYFPQYGLFNDLEIDGENGPAVVINAGANWQFLNSSVNSVRNTDPTESIFVVHPDTGASETRQVYIEATKIATGPGNCLDFEARDSLVVGSSISDCGKYAGANGLGGAKPAVPVVHLHPATDGMTMVGNILGFTFGQCCSGSNSTSVLVDSGAQRVVLGGNNYRLFNGTGEAVTNASGADKVTLTGGGIDVDGGQLSPFMQWGGSGGLNNFIVKNNHSAGGTMAQMAAATGTANAYAEATNTDGASPVGAFTCGVGDVGGCQFVGGAGNTTLGANGGKIVLAPQAAGLVQFANAGSFVVNGAVGVTIGAGPTSTSGNPSKWLLIEDNSGGAYVIPMWACAGCPAP